MTEVNEIEDIITKGMLLAEKSIRFHRSNRTHVLAGMPIITL